MNQKNKRAIFVGTLILLIGVALFLPKIVFASPGLWELLANIVLAVVSFVGRMVVLVTQLLISVAQYNDFINSPAVNIGWVVLRDICNMFFVLALLLIAFCSVLGIEQYSYKRALGGLILAIILVNFSKLILGFAIDIAQVVMLTFVNAFAAAGEGNFAAMFNLREIIALRSKGVEVEVGGLEIFVASLLALLLMIIALIVVLIITLLLIFRIVILWFLILFSPLAFLFGIFPQTQRYASDFWNRFSNQVIIGPFMAFFGSCSTE